MLVIFAMIAAHSSIVIGNFMQQKVSSAREFVESTIRTLSNNNNTTSPHRLMCDSLYLKLLKGDQFTASAFVRLFSKTEGCDDVFNMSEFRQEYTVWINADDSDRMTRVVEYRSNERDELILAQVLLLFFFVYRPSIIITVHHTSIINSNSLLCDGDYDVTGGSTL